jgi:Leucine-rich repeat (LRR) protein
VNQNHKFSDQDVVFIPCETSHFFFFLFQFDNGMIGLKMPHRRQPDHLTQLSLRSVGHFVQQTGQKLIERAVCADSQNSERKDFVYCGRLSTKSPHSVSECAQCSVSPQILKCDVLQRLLQPGLPQILANRVTAHLLDALTYLMNENIHLCFTSEITECHTILDVIEMLVVAAVDPRIFELVLSQYPDCLCLVLCRQLHRLTVLKVLKIHAVHDKGVKLAVRDLVVSSATSLKNLTVFIYENNCTDSILEVMSQNCTQLEHLDVMFSKKVTDQSVDSIKKFQNLKILNIWGTFITKRSCTQLLNVLPNLEDLVSDHKDSVHGVTKRTLGLKSLVTTNLESPHHLVNLCPYLTRLTLHAVHCTLAPLTALTSLQELIISNCDFSVIETFILSNGEQLISLKLQEVSAVNITLITYCTQLKTLQLSVCSYAVRNMPNDVLSSLHYENLEHLTIRGYYLRDFNILISLYRKLKTLNLLRVPVFRSEVIVDAVTTGKWKHLEAVSFNECGRVQIEALKCLMNSCCNLKKIMCREMEAAGRCELLDLKQYLKENNFDIEMVL